MGWCIWDNLLGVILCVMLLSLVRIIFVVNVVNSTPHYANHLHYFYSLQPQQHAQWHYCTNTNSNQFSHLIKLNWQSTLSSLDYWCKWDWTATWLFVLFHLWIVTVRCGGLSSACLAGGGNICRMKEEGWWYWGYVKGL